jgi:hypothetical protein
MSLSKIFLLAGAATLVSSAAFAGGHNVPSRASDVTGFHGVKAPSHGQSLEPKKKALCGTGFGAELPTPDGLISWNDTSGSGYDTGGGADFTCSAKAKIKEVWVYGYNAPANPELYNVNIYQNDGAGGSDEGQDGKKAKCSYTGLSGAGGGSYPTHVLTKLTLTTACKLKPGKYWVEVQDNDSAGPWYWEMTSTANGTQADWVDRNGVFAAGCTTLDDNEYLSNCLGYTYPDYMLELH